METTAQQQSAGFGEARAFRWIFGAATAVCGVLLACAVVVGAKLPLGEWDAMAYAIWSRQIAENWPHFQFAGVPAVDLHRPLFYYLEGTLWAIFGFHQPLGRLLGLAFGIVFAAAIAYTAWRTTRPRYGAIAAAIVLALLVASYPFERYLLSGMTDVPVAGMIALTAATVVVAVRRPRLVPLVAAAACLALLTKPTALASLVGLGGAILLGSRSGLRRRVSLVGAMAIGMLVALAYDAVEAHRLHTSTWSFMTSGTDGFYASLAAARRHDVLLDQSWLGGDLRLLLLFAVVYAVARLALRHRTAVAVALPAAVAWSLAGPRIAGGASGLVAGSGGSVQSAAAVVLAASLLFALKAPADAVPTRLELARLLVWLVPPLVVWVVYSAYELRLLGAAWPPLLLLMGRALVPAVAGAAEIAVGALVAPVGALLVIAALGTLQLNGFGRDGWHRFTSGFGDSAALRSLAVGGDFDAELAALEPQLPSSRRIVTADARLQFYYLDRVRLEAPQSCAQLRPPGTTLMLLESDEERAVFGDKATTAWWTACRNPRPTLVADRPGAFAVFTTGRPAAVAGSCNTAPTPGMSIEFGRFRGRAAAGALLARVRGAGFVQARIEQIGCELYRVVETGVPSESVGRSIVAEAGKAKLPARIVVLSG